MELIAVAMPRESGASGKRELCNKIAASDY